MEEVDELFAAKLWAWQFKTYQTHGAGRVLAALENEGAVDENAKTRIGELGIAAVPTNKSN